MEEGVGGGERTAVDLFKKGGKNQTLPNIAQQRNVFASFVGLCIQTKHNM